MNSTHPDAGRLLKQGLFSDLSAFAQFEQRLRSLANTKQVGDAFEILVEAYLHTQPKMQAANVWLVGQVPLRIRKQLNLPSDSKGIDGIFETGAGELVPYQVAPVSAVTHIAEVEEVVPYQNSGKMMLRFKGAAEPLENPIRLREGKVGSQPQSARYTSREKLLKAEFVDELW